MINVFIFYMKSIIQCVFVYMLLCNTCRYSEILAKIDKRPQYTSEFIENDKSMISLYY